jgi:glycosyltransferase involved in cell wall biosynthesis
MKVLTLSRNYPNNMLPHLGLWVEGLVAAMHAYCEQRVLAPVPYAPPVPGLPATYARFRRVLPHTQTAGVKNVPELVGGAGSASNTPGTADNITGENITGENIDVWHPRFLAGLGYSLHSYEVEPYYWSVRRAVAHLRKEFPFDLIHAHFVYPDGVAAVRLGRSYGVPVILTEHSVWQPWMDNYPRVRSLARWAVDHCAFQIAASRYQRNSILAVTQRPDKLRLIPIGMAEQHFRLPPDDVEADPNQLVFVGRLQHVKGVDVLLRALPLLLARRPHLRLKLVGSSFYQHAAKEEQQLYDLVRQLGLDEHIEFAGPQPTHAVARIMQTSTLLVLPSRRESFGSVLAEALGCGIPVVATRCGGPEDIVTERVGALAEPENPAALAAAIECVLDNRSRYQAEELSAYAHRHFAWSIVAAQTYALYQEALA